MGTNTKNTPTISQPWSTKTYVICMRKGTRHIIRRAKNTPRILRRSTTHILDRALISTDRIPLRITSVICILCIVFYLTSTLGASCKLSMVQSYMLSSRTLAQFLLTRSRRDCLSSSLAIRISVGTSGPLDCVIQTVTATAIRYRSSASHVTSAAAQRLKY
jgi:hypothetical protein